MSNEIGKEMDALVDAYMARFGGLPFGVSLDDPEYMVPLLRRALDENNEDVFYEGVPPEALI